MSLSTRTRILNVVFALGLAAWAWLALLLGQVAP